MTVIIMMITVVFCYTICSLSDKYAVSTAKFNGNEFTFLMAAATAVFMLVCLPFQDCTFTLSWQSFAAIGLIAASKMLEFQMGALVLLELSAFELKAWLGIILFVSYITDIIYGAQAKIICFVFIALTAGGLILIAQQGRKDNINYKKIIIPLIVYLAAKFGYGFVIKAFTPYISSTMQLFWALVLMAAILLPKAKPRDIFRKNPKGAWVVILTKIPNVAGLLLENAVIAVSLANYSFIQPMILIALFAIGLIKKDKYTKLSLAGSIVCIAGIVGFQIASIAV
ncbi:MAG: hypothetical protein Q4E74_09610 [Ruminococcus sp.]|nr:hypothetical protein [Ruminococcus sp.]